MLSASKNPHPPKQGNVEAKALGQRILIRDETQAVGIALRLPTCMKPHPLEGCYNNVFGVAVLVKQSASSRTNLRKLYQRVIEILQYMDSLSQGTQRPNSVGHVALRNKACTTETNLSVAYKTKDTKSNWSNVQPNRFTNIYIDIASAQQRRGMLERVHPNRHLP